MRAAQQAAVQMKLDNSFTSVSSRREKKDIQVERV